MRVVEHVLTAIKDETKIGPQMLRCPALDELVRGYNKVVITPAGVVATGYDVATTETNGLDFKCYFSCLPSHDQLRLLGAYLNRLIVPLPTDNMEEVNLVLRPTELAGRPTNDAAVIEDLLNGADAPLTLEAKRQALHLRHWLIKAGVICGSVVVCVMIGAVTAMMVANKQLPSNEIISKLMTSVVEVAKLLFSSK